MERRHCIRIAPPPARRVAGAEEDLSCSKKVCFFRGPALTGPRRGRRAESGECPARGVDVLAAPERLVVGEGLAPVSQNQAGVELLGLPESLDRFLVFELMRAP